MRDTKHVENAGDLYRSAEHGSSIHEPQTASRRREPPVECPQADAGKPGGSQQMDVDPSETTTMKLVRREEVHCLLVGNFGASRQIRQQGKNRVAPAERTAGKLTDDEGVSSYASTFEQCGQRW